MHSGSERKLGIEIPKKAAARIPTSASEVGAGSKFTEQEMVDFMRQVTAKAFALGDLSGKLTKANIKELSPYGTLLERAAMGFHHNGQVFAEPADAGAAVLLDLKQPNGEKAPFITDKGGYETKVLKAPGATTARESIFAVNGAAPRPGAPFADPCAVAIGTKQVDPFTQSWLGDYQIVPDPWLKGFRRYEASAVQLDMIVNRAGWHDPQARINVLTSESDRFKSGPGLISPLISDTEEPFFFRALSGECIEFRHTNELPKELELDDFQVKTPTDTIGQHIHLVKFDVTASDGSGNGWNYEDGTFAPDELAARLCAWAEVSDEAKERVARLDRLTKAYLPEEFSQDQEFCKSDHVKHATLWRLPRSKVPFLFQTTTQRWFADPILSQDGQGKVIDRTMRTVFTHDHFGPSSIQQHGFYSALLVEPPAYEGDGTGQGTGGKRFLKQLCDFGDKTQDCAPPLDAYVALAKVAWGGDKWEGARKLVETVSDDPTHPNFREFALSVADFALLYDPRDWDSAAALPEAVKDTTGQKIGAFGGLEGMAKLYCEAYWRRSPANLDEVCGSGLNRATKLGGYFYPDDPPSWLAGGAWRDDSHKDNYAGDLFVGTETNEVAALYAHLSNYRRKAAGRPYGDRMAKPVAGPVRPESISVDHHDPYLVNYRGAPIPLRIGDKDGDDVLSDDCAPNAMGRQADHPATFAEASDAVLALAKGRFDQCSRSHQIAGPLGDLGQALASAPHMDPETPILEACQGERLVIRLIQGAQEVQHTFNVVGQPFKRNIDQAFPQGMRPPALSVEKSLHRHCFDLQAIARSDPSEYVKWRDTAPLIGPRVHKRWEKYAAALAACDNIEGFTFAQEIGISEHFEMQGSLRSDVGASVEFVGDPNAETTAQRRATEAVPEKSSDYLYNFGSVDALWNGAWGLVRIFEDAQAMDPATVARFNAARTGFDAIPVNIGARLGSNTSKIGLEFAAAAVVAELPGGTGLSCPIPSKDPKLDVRLVDAVVVAFETRRVFDTKGTRYGEGVYDPDGLMLALLAPEDLAISDIALDAPWDALSASEVIRALRRVYKNQPEPFVLRVQAGDCLRLRVLNLLEGEDAGLRDLLGDAILPKIVPLNADPIPHIKDNGKEGPAKLQWIGLDAPSDPNHPGGVRPSARLALNFGLPGLDLLRDVPQGFGYAPPALAPWETGSLSTPMLPAYAGRYRIDLENEKSFKDGASDQLGRRAKIHAKDLLENVYPQHPVAVLKDLLAKADVDFQFRYNDNAASGLTRLLGHGFDMAIPSEDLKDGSDGDLVISGESDLSALIDAFCDNSTGCITPEEMRGAFAEIADVALRKAMSEHTHWIPYAFGAVPVKSTSDVISHATHGLMGSIVVTPTSWTADDHLYAHCETIQPDGYTRCSARPAQMGMQGQPQVYTVEGLPDQIEPIRLREFVLFWQDGLNHWDENGPIVKWNDAKKAREGGYVELAGQSPMVPDCPVCDDSYDRGEAGVSHTSPAHSRLLRMSSGQTNIQEYDDLNGFEFPSDYVVSKAGQLRLTACANEQVVVRVVHPGGRARQRAFVMNGLGYDDLFPGFGFRNAALLAPGKTINAWLTPRERPDDAKDDVETFYWHDGPTHLRAGGVWGVLDVLPEGSEGCKE